MMAVVGGGTMGIPVVFGERELVLLRPVRAVRGDGAHVDGLGGHSVDPIRLVRRGRRVMDFGACITKYLLIVVMSPAGAPATST